MELHRLEYNPAEGASDSDSYCEILEAREAVEGKETTAIPKIQVWVLKGALCGLELHEVKVSRAVLRGACGLVIILWGGNAPRLPDPTRAKKTIMKHYKFKPLRFDTPITLEFDLYTHNQAMLIEFLPGAKRIASRTVSFELKNFYLGNEIVYCLWSVSCKRDRYNLLKKWRFRITIPEPPEITRTDFTVSPFLLKSF